MIKNYLILLLSIFSITGLSAQTTETFETVPANAKSFVSNGKTFSLSTNGINFYVYDSGSANQGYSNSKKFIHADDSYEQKGIISSPSGFKVNNLWIYLAGNALQEPNVTNDGAPGSVTFIGKLAGSTKFTVTKSNVSSNIGYASPGNGFTFVNFSNLEGMDNSNTLIDQLEIQLSANYDYFAIDNFTTSPNTVLPVDLISFTAKTENNSIRLDWTTQSENNNKSFTLLRSDNKINFNPIATINGQGNKQTKTEYTFNDRLPSAGTNYYQLVQTDYNGDSKQIGIKAAEFGLDAENLITLFPNPATTSVKVKFSQQTSRIDLVDLNGRLIETSKIDSSATFHNFNVAKLPAGIYFIKLNQEVATKSIKFIKI
ncbi:T9SS type A sorting domain-containing protein [Pedobacter xixiisoli]|uniref:Por secretion system C-terminal sorting domain-containing protein n=1 Tax=Pedobacter xixiisoli TaxID=1476464 RepID=A0A285ZT41_9SPHI|nr:T9SS type A sorting domain-containing protein [Pedobacter xixiisoli]SOD12812.1 Por secretion system C-terminal sorting domain-containing protein [Pedobacter xixiisoli]